MDTALIYKKQKEKKKNTTERVAVYHRLNSLRVWLRVTRVSTFLLTCICLTGKHKKTQAERQQTLHRKTKNFLAIFISLLRNIPRVSEFSIYLVYHAFILYLFFCVYVLDKPVWAVMYSAFFFHLLTFFLATFGIPFSIYFCFFVFFFLKKAPLMSVMIQWKWSSPSTSLPDVKGYF